MLHTGMLTGACSISDSASRDAKKNVLVANGAAWALSSANTLYNIQNGMQKEDIGYGIFAAKATLAALCLWRGLEDKLDED
jgi:hypothetical protein